MNVCHRYFAQYMLKNGITTTDKALKFCKHISKGNIETQTQLKTLIIELNRRISAQFYKIVVNTCEVTNQDVVVWLNTKNDDISKHQITFSALELEYFQVILQQILESDEYRITFIVCINITSTLTAHFSRDNGQKLLDKWLKGGYYIKRGEFIYLGPRTILEFTAFLRSRCPDCICKLCSELVFTGKQCGQCYKKLHSYCLAKYLLNQNECPCCKNVWTTLGGEAQQNNDTNLDEDMDINEMETVLVSPSTSQQSVAGYTHMASETISPSTSQQSEIPSPVVTRHSQRNKRNQESNKSLHESRTRTSKRKKL